MSAGNGKDKNINPNAYTPFQEEIRKSRRVIKSFKAKANRNRSISEKLADWMTITFGTVLFLAINIALFAFWISANNSLIPGVPVFDPYPFGLLTTIVSLEAIVLAIFVLISQNRQSKIDELREEVNYQIGLISEKEITKILGLVAKIAEKQKIDISKDEILAEMLQPTNTEGIEKTLERQMESGAPILPLKKISLPTIPEAPNPLQEIKKLISDEK